MASEDEIELRVERVVAGGDGLARHPDGRVVFVPAAAPGDLARTRLTRRRKDFARAEILELLEPGPTRIRPPCPHVDEGCGGCGWQHLDPVAARGHKQELVAESARRIGRFDVDVLSGPDLAVDGFRTTVRVVADRRGRLGFREARSHRPVAVDRCMVAHPLVDEVLRGARLDTGGEVTLRASPSTGERLALVHGAESGALTGAPDDVLVRSETELDDGAFAELRHVVGAHDLVVSARSFFQTRHDGAEALVEVVGRAVADAPDGPFLDLYGGVGLFSVTTGGGRPVVLVESSASSIADARRNLAGRDATVIEGRVEDVTVPEGAVVVADPPRAGLGEGGVATVASTGAGTVVLVSCDAAAFARDVSRLNDLGYRTVRCELVDLFPRTPHVEIVTLLVGEGG